MKIHKNITIKGRVQGVGFRYSALKKALEYNIFGYVKNQYDGSVYIEAEGEEINIENFIRWCKNGPRYSYVIDVEITDGSVKNYSSFYVR
ncbi:MAG: acylphosphatase [Bacteroidales bacterium]|nr:acylphosphatase [Bacteroidales bacterium]